MRMEPYSTAKIKDDVKPNVTQSNYDIHRLSMVNRCECDDTFALLAKGLQS